MGYRDRFSNRTLFLLYSGYFLVFALIGSLATRWLTTIPNLAVYKVYNLVGQLYNLIAVILLTPLVSERDRINRLVVGPIAEAFHGATTGIFCGVLVGATLARTSESSAAVGALLTPSMLMIFVNINLIGVFVAEQSNPLGLDVRRRAKVFGAITLGVGLLLQLYGAYLDLIS